MAQAKRGARTREDIVGAATRLFALHGYFNTSLNDILEAASISKGAFYHHFHRKKELALAALQRLQADYEQELFEPVRVEAEPDQRWRLMLKKIVALNQSGQWDHCLMLARLAQETARQEGLFPEQVAQALNRLIDFWRELIVDAQTAGAVRDDLDAPILAELIVTTLLGAVGCREINDRPVQLDKITEHLTLLISR
ncbi:TetR/AcrR family transcriptional regulator [Planctomycetota bacterium]